MNGIDDFDEFATPTKKRNPLVLAGTAATVGVLAAGLIAFKKGNHQVSQQMMRARVIFQGATVAVMAVSAGAVALDKS